MIGEMLRPFRFGQVRTTLRALVNGFHRLTSFNACLPRGGKLHLRWAGIRPIFSLVKSVLSAVRPSKQPTQMNFVDRAGRTDWEVEFFEVRCGTGSNFAFLRHAVGLMDAFMVSIYPKALTIWSQPATSSLRLDE